MTWQRGELGRSFADGSSAWVKLGDEERPKSIRVDVRYGKKCQLWPGSGLMDDGSCPAN